MSPDGMDEDRAAVLEVVRSFFSESESSMEELLAGPLRDWATLVGEAPWADQFETRRALEHVEVLELGAARAMVDVRAGQRSAMIRGAVTREFRFDGPAVLEKADGAWRLVDFTMDGRWRLQSIVIGPLAVQEHGGVTVRVLAADRTAQATFYVVELVNAGLEPIRVAKAHALFETETAWVRLSFDSQKPIPAGESANLLLAGTHPIELDETLMAVALQVRSGTRRVPFRLKVPVIPPETLVPQAPPRWLPVMRSTWPRSLLLYAALTVGAAWFYGWLAIAVPLYLAVAVYRSVRAGGHLPDRLHPARHVVDAAVAACVFLILWETPAVNLAVPVAVAALVYVALVPLGKKGEEARVLLALSFGAAWLFLLGLSNGPLSPCRIADGRPAAAADEFAHALLVGDLDRARRREVKGSRLNDVEALRPVSVASADAIVDGRAGVTNAAAWCKYFLSERGDVGCYRYSLSPGKDGTVLLVGVGCSGRRWLVDEWFVLPFR